MRLTQLHSHNFTTRYLMLVGGEAFSKVCVMGAFAYLARVLAPADYGTVELALSITVFFVLGVESGMGLYGARVAASAPEELPRLVPRVMTLRILLGAPAFMVILLLAAHYRMAGLGILAVNGIAVLLTPFLTQWVFQGLRQMQWVAAGTATRNFVFVATILALVRPGSDLRLVALAEVCGIVALALVNALLLHGALRLRLDWTGLASGTRRLFGEIWFMGLNDFTWACMWYSPALIIGWLGLGRTEQVAWVAASVRIVLSAHTFVWLYFFNMLPNMAKALSIGRDSWRDLIQRSMSASIWPACLIGAAGTLGAPVFVPLVFGSAYEAAVLPFQLVIWMIPVSWFSGHFRFSLIAAGLQRWEFAVSAQSAVVTVIAAVVLGHYFNAVGAAAALLAGGVVNAVLATITTHRRLGSVSIGPSVVPALVATALSLGVGASISAVAGALAGTVAGSLVYMFMATRYHSDWRRLVAGWIHRR